jgi:hypothetical protein
MSFKNMVLRGYYFRTTKTKEIKVICESIIIYDFKSNCKSILNTKIQPQQILDYFGFIQDILKADFLAFKEVIL